MSSGTKLSLLLVLTGFALTGLFFFGVFLSGEEDIRKKETRTFVQITRRTAPSKGCWPFPQIPAKKRFAVQRDSHET